MRTILVIPAYQCEKQIGRVLAKIPTSLAKRFERIWVIENRSSDATLRAAIEAARSSNLPVQVEVFENVENLGLGGTHKAAFQAALKQGATHVAVIHGDDQGSPAELAQFLDLCERRGGASILGARFMVGSRLAGYPLLRIVGNLAFNLLYSLFTGRLIFDIGGGANLLRLSDVGPERWPYYANQFTFNMDVLLDLIRRKVPFHYVPMSWSETDQVGTAKIFRVGLRALATLFKWWTHQERPDTPGTYTTTRVYPEK